MARRWPKDMAWIEVVLDVDNPWCGQCGRRMHVRAHGHHGIVTFEGPVHLIGKLMQCIDPACPNHRRTFGAEQARTWTMPRWLIGWDVFCWLGHRRFARHWSVPQLRLELLDSYDPVLSDDAIEDYLHHYQCLLAARQPDPVRLQEEYQKTGSVMLRMSEALGEVQQSLRRNLRLKKGGKRTRCSIDGSVASTKAQPWWWKRRNK